MIAESSTASDINERKRAEAPRRDCEECFQLVANTAPVMIWISGVDKLCTYVNQPWLDFTGRPLEAELGNGWSESVHPDDVSPLFGKIRDRFR
jgi:PAS domain-containing protein